MNNSKSLYYIILVCLFVIMNKLGQKHIEIMPEYNYRIGQIADKDIIAPLDFPLIKTEEQLRNEKEEAEKRISKTYYISDDIYFNALKVLDEVFINLNQINNNVDFNLAISKLKESGYEFDLASIKAVVTLHQQNDVYTKIKSTLNEIYQRGIYDNIPEEVIMINGQGKAISVKLDTLLNLEQAKNLLMKRITNSNYTSFIRQLSNYVVMPNVVVDINIYNEKLNKELNEISKSDSIIHKNEVIIQKNTRITETDLNEIYSLQRALHGTSRQAITLNQFLSIASLFIYYFLIIFLFAMVVQSVIQSDDSLNIKFYFIILSIIVNGIMYFLTSYLFHYSILLIPIGLFSVATLILIGKDFSVKYTIINSLLVLPLIGWDVYNLMIVMIANLGTILLVSRLHEIHEYFSIWVYHFSIIIAVIFCAALIRTDSIVVTLYNFSYAIIGTILTIIGLVLIVPYYEHKWNLATKQTLLELLDFNHPLLKRLATEAIGTYHHSLIVGNLSERAAEVIGANPLLARVGSYFHDIGKLNQPDIFTENNPKSELIHKELTPLKSAELIMKHVSDGVELALKYKIPSPVIDIIQQHHGNGIIKYFHQKAGLKNHDIDPQDYRYNCPKPTSKEASLVMISDIVESISKSKEIINENTLSSIIETTIFELFKSGQLDEAPLTMSDLVKIKICMQPILESIYRKRVDYSQ